MNRTSIEWTDWTANPLKFRDADGRVVWACVHASPGCQHCYAETLAKRYGRGGPFTVPTMAKLTPFLDERELHRMLTYKPASGKRVFVGDMTDLFGEWVPDELLDRLFAVFALRPDVTWQVLTKRAERMREYVGARTRMDSVTIKALGLSGPRVDELQMAALTVLSRWPLPNAWLGVSAEDQQRADERIPLLLDTPAAIRFVSAEPLLGTIDVSRWLGEPLHVADSSISCVGLDAQVRADSREDRENVSLPSDLPSRDAFPSASDSGLIPPDGTAERGGKPINDGPVGRVDGEAYATGLAASTPPVDFSISIEQTSDVSDHGRVGWDRDAERSEVRACSSNGDTCRDEASLNSRTADSNDGCHLSERHPAFVEVGNRGVHVAPYCTARIDWLITGGESGPGARPCHVEWVRSIVGQCQAAGVPAFVKQLGSNAQFDEGCGDCDPCCAGQRCPYANVTLQMWLRNRKGSDPAEWPSDLRVREFPPHHTKEER